MSHQDWMEKSRLIQRHVLDLDEFQKAHSIGLYKAFRQEVATDILFYQASRTKKRTCYPHLSCQGENPPSIDFREVQDLSGDMELTRWGFFQARGSCEVLPLKDIDLYIIPAVGFDNRGYRLGMGWGTYDHSIREVHGFKIGLAFDFQVVDEVFCESHDLRCDYVVTEERQQEILE